MSNQTSGVSISEVYSAIDSRIAPLWREVNSLGSSVSRLDHEITDLRRFVEREIERLEREMREIGEMIVNAIDRQTAAVVGGVAATTLMVERTKSQIESDFHETRSKLELQTESTLQIEIGKKISEATSLQTKLRAFAQDIKTRFEKSIENAAVNRELYNVNFRKIRDEYENKIHTIGEHIFQIKMEDIAPAEKAALVPYEQAHSLPLEMDLQRLSIRSQNLDETLFLLKSSKLNDVVSALDELRDLLNAHSIGDSLPGEDVKLCVTGLVTTSDIHTRISVGLVANPVNGEEHFRSTLIDNSLACFASPGACRRAGEIIASRPSVPLSSEQVVSFSKAADSLKRRGLISEEACALFEDFLGSDKLRIGGV